MTPKGIGILIGLAILVILIIVIIKLANKEIVGIARISRHGMFLPEYNRNRNPQNPGDETMNVIWKPAAIVIALALTGCAGSMSGNVYSRERAQKVQIVEYGQVVEVRQVQIEGTKSPVGPLAGGALGGALGSGIGSGAGSTIAVVGGAIAGAAAGAAAEEAITKQNGLEITVWMDSGQTLSLVQGVDPPVRAGDRVKLMRSSDGSARVIPVTAEEGEEAPRSYTPR